MLLGVMEKMPFASQIQPGDVHGMGPVLDRLVFDTSLCWNNTGLLSNEPFATILPCDRAKQLLFNEPMMKLIKPPCGSVSLLNQSRREQLDNWPGVT